MSQRVAGCLRQTLAMTEAVRPQHWPTLLTLIIVMTLEWPSGILVPILCHHSPTYLAVLPWRERGVTGRPAGMQGPH